MSILSLPIQEAQKNILRNFRQMVCEHSPELTLDLFRELFIEDSNHSASDLSMTLYTIVMGKEQAVFDQTLTDVCHILVNAWRQQRESEAIAALWQCLVQRTAHSSTSSVFAQRLQQWLAEFSTSDAFESLRAVMAIENGWPQRYGEYLAISQDWDKKGDAEACESGQILAQKLKDQFQFELAKYVSLSQRQGGGTSVVDNPTALGEAVIPLIKRILLRRDHFCYEHLADRLGQQMHQMRYRQFKKNLLKYLSFAMPHPIKDESFRAQISAHLSSLNAHQDAEIIQQAHILSTCESLIAWLTTVDKEHPTDLFVQGTAGVDPRALVLLLLKIVLVCPSVQSYLDSRIADLIRVYGAVSFGNCQDAINFFEIFRIIFAIYVGGQEYTLVKVGGAEVQAGKGVNLNDYRIFAQRRGVAVAG